MTQQYVSITEYLRLLLCQALDRLLDGTTHDCGPVAAFEEVRQILEALPLASADFSLAMNRLANAEHYLQSGERGAARYELHLLRQGLSSARCNL